VVHILDRYAMVASFHGLRNVGRPCAIWEALRPPRRPVHSAWAFDVITRVLCPVPVDRAGAAIHSVPSS
jgi:hypothetical protein